MVLVILRLTVTKKVLIMLKFKATEEQVLEMIRNAINSSLPVGMGYLHYEDVLYTIDDLKQRLSRTINRDGQIEYCVDYFHGRMVKLSVYSKYIDGEVWWVLPYTENGFSSDYQSFADMFPTPSELLASVNLPDHTVLSGIYC